MSCLTYLESTFSLLGYLGEDIFVNKMLNSYVGPTEIARGLFVMNCLIGHFGDDEDDLNEAFLQASAEFESKLRLVQQLHPWLWLRLGRRAPSTTRSARRNQTHFLLLVHPYVCVAKNTTMALQNYTVALQELEPHYQPIKLQYFK